MSVLAANVRRLRRASGLSQDGLAYLCGVSAVTIYNLEHGIYKTNIDTFQRICTALEVTPNELLGWGEGV